MSTPLAQLAPTGVLRAGINLSNFLLVTGRAANDDPVGVAPDLAAELARRLGVPVRYVPYETPAMLADATGTGAWDVGLIGAEPQRAETIAFTPAYVEIESTYLVPAGSPLKTLEDVDRPGVRIAVTERTAYGLWLDRNIRHAELVRSGTLDSSFEDFRDKGLEALAGLRPRLLSDVTKMPGARILEGKFAAVQQAIGVPKANEGVVGYLAQFVAEAKSSGLVADLIRRHNVVGLSVAP